jgi:hypothetical protein
MPVSVPLPACDTDLPGYRPGAVSAPVRADGGLLELLKIFEKKLTYVLQQGKFIPI